MCNFDRQGNLPRKNLECEAYILFPKLEKTNQRRNLERFIFRRRIMKNKRKQEKMKGEPMNTAIGSYCIVEAQKSDLIPSLYFILNSKNSKYFKGGR
jgi:hypothetical protein